VPRTPGKHGVILSRWIDLQLTGHLQDLNGPACKEVGDFAERYFGDLVQEYNTSDTSTSTDPTSTVVWTAIATPARPPFHDYFRGKAKTDGRLPAPLEGTIAVYGPAALVLILIGLAALL
jgi:hypothetical protein